MEITKRKLMVGPRYLTFLLEFEAYCMEILRVKELRGMSAITPIPQTPNYIRGVINLRGQIIPIVDLRLKFGLPFREYTKRTSIIVVELDVEGEPMLMGLVVDSIQEVISIPDDKMNSVPYINARVKSEFIRGVATTDDGIKIVLDVVKILSSEDFVIVQQTTAGSTSEAEPQGVK